MAEEAIDRQIEEVLDKVRPFLKREGGDIEYIGFKDGVVYVRMIGACNGCLYADADISQGVEIILMEEVPGVIRCDASMNLPEDVMNEYLARKEKEMEAPAEEPKKE
ncbi:MAG: NifU family protein [Bacilli bacterium]|nr:NifU family protein [Bacilli bacterium]